jgi:endonuclease YncB( thermonuclease family)
LIFLRVRREAEKARKAPFLFFRHCGARVLAILRAVVTLPSTADECRTARYDQNAVVAGVIDGDTLRLREDTVMRLIGINAAELARDGRAAETLAAASRRLLRRHLPAVASDWFSTNAVTIATAAGWRMSSVPATGRTSRH